MFIDGAPHMTTRTITIPAPEWEQKSRGSHSLLLAGIELASVVLGTVGWRATVRFTTTQGFDDDLPSAKAWAEKRALELLGVRE